MQKTKLYFKKSLSEQIQTMTITLYRPSEEKYSFVAWKIRLALAEKSISYKTTLVSLTKNEHKSDHILKLNPKGTLPILQDDDVVLYDEEAMLHYLEQFYPQHRLLPSTLDKKLYSEALILYYEVVHIFEKTVQPLLFLFLQNNSTITTTSDSSSPRRCSSCCNRAVTEKNTTNEEVDLAQLYSRKQKVMQELLRWEKLLVAHKGQFLIGDSITLADVSFFPLLAHLHRYGLALHAQFPKLDQYLQRMYKRSSVQRTLPQGWKLTKKQWLK